MTFTELFWYMFIEAYQIESLDGEAKDVDSSLYCVVFFCLHSAVKKNILGFFLPVPSVWYSNWHVGGSQRKKKLTGILLCRQISQALLLLLSPSEWLLSWNPFLPAST